MYKYKQMYIQKLKVLFYVCAKSKYVCVCISFIPMTLSFPCNFEPMTEWMLPPFFVPSQLSDFRFHMVWLERLVSPPANATTELECTIVFECTQPATVLNTCALQIQVYEVM